MLQIPNSGTTPQCRLIRVIPDQSDGQNLLKISACTESGESTFWIKDGGDVDKVLDEIGVRSVGRLQLNEGEAMLIDCNLPLVHFQRARALFCVHPDTDKAGEQYLHQIAKHVAALAEEYEISWKVQKCLITVTGRLSIRFKMLVPKRWERRRLMCYVDDTVSTDFSNLDLLAPVPAGFDEQGMLFSLDGQEVTAEAVAKHLVESAL